MTIMEETISLENTYIELVNGKNLKELNSEILQIDTEKQ